MRRGEGFRRVEAEIRREQAEALGRTGERLEAVLRELAERDRRLDDMVGSPGERARSTPLPAEMEARNRLRGEALRLVYALIVQREALGMTRHALVAERYPIPPPRAIQDCAQKVNITGS